MDGRLLAGATLAVAASVLGGFAMVHARSAGERAREAERRIEDLSARLQKLEDAAPVAPVAHAAGPAETPAGDSGPNPAAASSPAGETGARREPPPGDRSEPRPQAWAALPQEERRAVLEIVKEAQKELRQQEVWGWAKGIQANFTRSLREKLQLTADQEDRVAAVLKVYLPEMNKVWHSPEGTPEEQSAKSAELWAKVDGEIAPLLTGEQAIQYEAWRKEQAERAKKHSESGGR